MKLAYLLLSFILIGCSAPQEETGASFKVGLRSFASTGGTAQFEGGLILYGVSPGKSFSRIMASDTIDEIIPNGVWDFHVLGWDGNGTEPMSGVVYCASQKGVELNGEPVSINLNATNANCADPFYGNTSVVGGFNHFPTISIQTCNYVDGTLSFGDQCNYSTAIPGYTNKKGTALSYRVMAQPFNRVNGVVNPIDGPKHLFKCSKVETTIEGPNSGALQTASLGEISDLNIPILGADKPWVFTLRAYYGSDNCVDAYGYKDIHLPAQPDSPHAKIIYDGGQNQIFAKTSPEEVCASPHQTATDFKGGTGAIGAPYVVCSGKDLLTMSSSPGTYNNKRFILGKHIDMNPYSAAINPSGAPDCAEDGENFRPLGVLYNGSCGFNAVNPFIGVFDGNGKSIKNLRVQKEDSAAAHPHVGFIPLLGDGTNPGKLLNVKFIRPEVVGYWEVGIVGRAQANSIISNVEVVDGNFESQDGRLGSVVGFFEGVLIERALVEKTHIRSRGGDNIGGILGYMLGSGSVSQVSFNGEIDAASGSGSNSVGGIAGYIDVTATLDQAVSRGSIIAGGNQIGGIVGWSYVDVTNAYSNMFIHNYSGGAIGLGGIAGKFSGTIIDQVYFNGMINCDSCSGIGEIVGTLSAGGFGTHVYFHENSLTPAGPMNGSLKTETAMNNDTTDLISPPWSASVSGRYPKLEFEKAHICDLSDSVGDLSYQHSMGRGTQENPVTLCSVERFKEFMTAHQSGKHYLLGENLPLGIVAAGDIVSLNSNLNGNGKNLMNVALDGGSHLTVGLFSSINTGASVKNLGLLGASVTAPAQPTNYTGLLAGSNSGTIDNVRVRGTIDHATLNDRLGLIAGENFGKILRSKADGSIRGVTYLGGLVAFNDGEIGTSSARVKIEGAASGFENVGGLVAKNSGNIYQSSAHDDISASDPSTGNLGLFVGSNLASGMISDSYVDEGDLSVNGDNTTAGLGGFAGNNSGTIQRSYTLGKILYGGTVGSGFGGFAGTGGADSSNLYFYDPLDQIPYFVTDGSPNVLASMTCTGPDSLYLSLTAGDDLSAATFPTGSYFIFDEGRSSALLSSLDSSTFSDATFTLEECPADFEGNHLSVHTSVASNAFGSKLTSLSEFTDISNFTYHGWDIAQYNGDGTGVREDELLNYYISEMSGQSVSPPMAWEVDGDGAPRLLGLKHH